MSEDPELDRQLQCIVKRLKALAMSKAKGSLTVQLDGSGYFGKQFETRLFEWRDSFSDTPVGREISDHEFARIIEQQSKHHGR